MHYGKRLIAGLCCAAILCGTAVGLPGQISCKAAPEQGTAVSAAAPSETEYAAYRAASPDDSAGEVLKLDAAQASVSAEGDYAVYRWDFTAPVRRYYVKITYRYEQTAGNVADGKLLLNGAVPYAQLADIEYSRMYEYDREFVSDIYGNDITPTLRQVTGESWMYLYNRDGDYAERLSLIPAAGQNTVALYAGKPVKIIALELCPVGNTPTYAEYIAAHRADGAKEYGGDAVKVQAEKARYTSKSSIYPISERDSAQTEPIKSGKVRLNVMGGYRWQRAGEFVEWEVEAPAAGLYRMTTRSRQNTLSGQTSAHILFVNGEVPFREAQAIRSPYSDQWKLNTLGSEKGAYLVYLEKGVNQVRLQATLAEQDEIIRDLEQCLGELNQVYISLLTIMGSSPDLLRDYKLDEIVPEQLEIIARQKDVLADLTAQMRDYMGSNNSGVALLDVLYRQLIKMCKDCDNIPGEFSYFKSNIGSIGTWLYEAVLQPIEIDYFLFDAPDAGQPRVNAPFFRQLWFEVKEFIFSYMIDYEAIGKLDRSEGSNKRVQIWVSTGRDQTQTLRNLIASSFTPDTGITVDLKLTQTSLLAATVSGTGPDAVALSGPDVFNFAMRNAAYKLSSFPDFEEVRQRFPQALLIPLSYLDGVYGLPESIAFEVLLYRTDIFADLGLEVPRTWEDVIHVSSLLAHHNMEVGMPNGGDFYITLLMQNGLKVYNEDDTECIIDSQKHVEVFQQYTDFYSKQGFPLSYDLVNRFRSGEMPLAVTDFATYCTLQISAPEIKGLWNMALCPGTRREDGTINNTITPATSACMILSQAKNPENAWEFLKWWTSAKTQQSFGVEIESLLGESAQYSSANIEAFANSLWPSDFKKVLSKQIGMLDSVENVPGGYYLSRHLTNAFRQVVYNDKRALDVMYDYTYKINGEITKKRHEFGLD